MGGREAAPRANAYLVINQREHEVRERDYFFVVSFQIWGVFAGIGLVNLITRAALSRWKLAAAALMASSAKASAAAAVSGAMPAPQPAR